MDRAIVHHPNLSSGRIIAVSDIHGNLPFFQALMAQIALKPQDNLILLGDMLEKGRDSLGLLRHLMQLSKTHTVLPVCGNCDGLVLRFFETDQLDEIFFSLYLPRHPESTLRQLAREGGFDQVADLPRLRAQLRQTFPQEWAWLRAMPTILETEHLVFVHGGVPSSKNMDQLERWGCMKNDDFLGQGHSFDKWVIVGHWPVTLYHPHIPSAAPILLPQRKIISIDGGCVLKVDGQLNALILPHEDCDAFSWHCWDGLPTATALTAQQESAHSVNIRWGRSDLVLLQPGEETSLCRHVETGVVLPILNTYLRRSEHGHLTCEDSTDYCLPVSPGDQLSIVQTVKHGFLCKKAGITGWYYGQISDIIEAPQEKQKARI